MPVKYDGPEIHHWFEQKGWPDYSEESGFLYEWVNHTQYVTVWPKGSFSHKPEEGRIDLKAAAEVMGIEYPYDSRHLTIDWVCRLLNFHEQTIKGLAEIDGQLGWHHAEETEEWIDAIQCVLDNYYTPPEVWR